MVAVAFGCKSLKSFLKCCASFFLINFAFAGIMLVISITVAPDATIYKNGIVYFNINIFTLTIASVICYATLNLINKFTKSKVPQKSIYPLRITYGERTVEGKALLDTGNTLCDCFSGKPVIITEKAFTSHLCDGSEITEMKSFRLIPFSTIKNGGALPAFLADKAEIMDRGKWIGATEIYIAVTENKIVSGNYSALLGMPFFDAIDNKIKGGISVK
jgi:stage II sporulation protein GA (sporulation sigma-E factor processing peptidase)